MILDIWMKEMDGLEIQSEVSKISAKTRVIIITGDINPVTKNAALSAGAIAFFIKHLPDGNTIAQKPFLRRCPASRDYPVNQHP